jgi:hypothetical protein
MQVVIVISQKLLPEWKGGGKILLPEVFGGQAIKVGIVPLEQQVEHEILIEPEISLIHWL